MQCRYLIDTFLSGISDHYNFRYFQNLTKKQFHGFYLWIQIIYNMVHRQRGGLVNMVHAVFFDPRPPLYINKLYYYSRVNVIGLYYD